VQEIKEKVVKMAKRKLGHTKSRLASMKRSELTCCSTSSCGGYPYRITDKLAVNSG
jgi:hypothetical protein